MFSPIPILCLLIPLAVVVNAQDFPAGYTGCYTFPASGQITGLNPAEFNLPHNNRGECIATCFQSEILAPHAFFWYTIDPTNEEVAIPNCRCSYPPPPIDTWKHGDATRDCIVEAVGDSYGDLIDPSSPAAFPVNSPEDCLSICPTSTSDLRYTVIQVDQSKNWSCRCITDVSDILPFPETVLINCDIGAYFMYNYISTVMPSQAVRKRQHQRRILSGGKKEGDLCPVGLEACPVLRDSQKGDYECVDTTLELESCGGCVFGSDTSGVDCTTLPGISPAAVLCSQGECRALACAEGFTLVEGSCVSVLAE